MDSYLDTLLPGCLPFKMDASIATTTKHLHHDYDHHLYSNMEDNNSAHYILQSMAPSTLLDRQTAYAEDKYTILIMQCLLSHT